MAVLKVDPPPETDDIRVLRAWANEFYEQASFVLNNISEDNLDSDFFDKLSGSIKGGGDSGL